MGEIRIGIEHTLSYTLTALADIIQEWVDAVDYDTSWDGWSHHFKKIKHVVLPNTRAFLASVAPGVSAQSETGSDKRWRHVKRGTTYRELGRGELQSGFPVEEQVIMVAYQSEHDGRVWFRPASEFDDGRFAALSPPPTPGVSAPARVGSELGIDQADIERVARALV